jgi:hypothetical protein
MKLSIEIKKHSLKFASVGILFSMWRKPEWEFFTLNFTLNLLFFGIHIDLHTK